MVELGIIIPFLHPDGSTSQSPSLFFVLQNLVSLSQQRGYLLFVLREGEDPFMVIFILLNGFFNLFESMVFLRSLLMSPFLS